MTNYNRVIYLIGPYYNKDPHLIKANVVLAQLWAARLWQHCTVISPHLNIAPLAGQQPEEVFMQGCLELVERSDAVFVISGWHLSPGSLREVSLAEYIELPTLTTIKEVELWLKKDYESQTKENRLQESLLLEKYQEPSSRLKAGLLSGQQANSLTDSLPPQE